jgi:hypothetical protein
VFDHLRQRLIRCSIPPQLSHARLRSQPCFPLPPFALPFGAERTAPAEPAAASSSSSIASSSASAAPAFASASAAPAVWTARSPSRGEHGGCYQAHAWHAASVTSSTSSTSASLPWPESDATRLFALTSVSGCSPPRTCLGFVHRRKQEKGVTIDHGCPLIAATSKAPCYDAETVRCSRSAAHEHPPGLNAPIDQSSSNGLSARRNKYAQYCRVHRRA